MLPWVAGEIEEPADLGDRHFLGAGRKLEDLVAGLNFPLLQNAEIEARAVVRDEQRGNARIFHPDPDAVTGDARLRDLERRAADPVAVADTDLVVAEPFDREVLAELPVDEVGAFELLFPVSVGVELVDEDGTLLATVPRDVALPVTFDVELGHPARAGHWVLEDARKDGLSLPGHILRETDVDRHQPAHKVGGSA